MRRFATSAFRHRVRNAAFVGLPGAGLHRRSASPSSLARSATSATLSWTARGRRQLAPVKTTMESRRRTRWPGPYRQLRAGNNQHDQLSGSETSAGSGAMDALDPTMVRISSVSTVRRLITSPVFVFVERRIKTENGHKPRCGCPRPHSHPTRSPPSSGRK